MSATVFCVVGNPNCGKTTLFNALTGGRADVGNWPGVTVEKKIGRFALDEETVDLVDLPGVYSLNPASSSSEDERVARDYILSGQAQIVINIVDASNLERNLYLTAQLLEMRVPMIVAVNMLDIAQSRGLEIDVASLSRDLGCPVVPLVANRRKGLEELRTALLSPQLPTATISYPPAIEGVLDNLVAHLPASAQPNRRWQAIQLLEGDPSVAATVPTEVRTAAQNMIESLSVELGDDLDILLADTRYGFVGGVAGKAVIRKGEASRTLTDRIDRVVLHRLFGIPIFLAIMYLMFVFTINIGSAFIDFFDQFSAALLVDGFGHLLGSLGSPEWLTTLLAKGVGGGIQTVSTFIPVIGCLYLFLSVLEDSGYMARAAFVMDRFMRTIGLPGKAFVPLIVGFGCNVPAIMASRTMESRRDRIITVMMAPFMSCGARLPVYVLFASAFFPTNGQNLVFAMYLIGIAVAVLTGLLLKTTTLRGEASPFVMEMPPYHLPTLSGILIRTWDRLKAFILRAGRVIVIIVMALSFLNSVGTDGSFGNEDTDKSVLASIGKGLVPVFAPMGISEANWPATVGVFTGIFAKEAVVGTLNALYGGIAEAQQAANTEQQAATETPDSAANAQGTEQQPMAVAEGTEAATGEAPAVEEEAFDLGGAILEAFATIPENLGKVVGQLGDPLGLEVDDLSDTAAAAEAQEVTVSAITALGQLFDGQVGALAYLMMVLLYMPCVAAIAAVWREVGTRWTFFAAAWTTGCGYGAAVLTYQIGTFSRDPLSSGIHIGIVLAILAAAIIMMRRAGRDDDAPTPHAPRRVAAS